MSAPGREAWTEADWRLVAESIPHLVWVADGDGRTLFFNERGVAYSGAPASTMGWPDLVHPDDLDRVIRAWEHAQRTSTPLQEDVRLRRADGVYLWHSASSEPLTGNAGEITRWFGTATDIDARKVLEEGLRVAQAEASDALRLLTELQAAAPIGFGLIDRDFRVVQVNEELARFADVPVADQIGRTAAEVAPAAWRMLEPIYRHVLTAGVAVRSIPMAGAAGPGGLHTEWVASFYPVRIDEDLVGIGVVAVDVTDRLQAEGFRTTVMNQVTCGVYTQDPDGLLTYMNRAASRMLGWSEVELCGQNVHDVVHHQPGDRPPIPASECLLLTQGADRRLVQLTGEAFTRKDGSTFPVAYSSMPLRVGSRVDGVSVVFQDLSEWGTSPQRVRVLIADPDRTSRATVTAALASHDGLEVVGAVSTVAAALEATRRQRPHVVLVDAELPEDGGVAAAVMLRADSPDSNIILLALDYDDALAAGAIAAGCSGIVDKRRVWVDLADAVRAAHHGQTSISQAELQQVVAKVRDSWRPGRAQDLTARERDVLRCMTQGLTNQMTATKLGVTVNTVRNHVQRILYKLDVHSRLEAVVLATRGGLLDQPG